MTAAVGGGFIVLCAVTAATALAVGDVASSTDNLADRLPYPAVTWPLLLTLAAAGVVIMARRRRSRAAALLAAVVATQAAGIGLTAIPAWSAARSFRGMHYISVAPIAYAAGALIAVSAAAVAAAALVWREPAGGWRGLVPARPSSVAAGLAVAVALPMAGTALTYALPWGAGLVVAGWMRGRSAAAAALTVAVAAVLCALFVLGVHVHEFLTTPPDGD